MALADRLNMTTPNGIKHKHKYKNKKFVTFICAHFNQVKGSCTGCGRNMCLDPDGQCIPIGNSKHFSSHCYLLSGAEPPPTHLFNNCHETMSIVDKMKKLTDKLALNSTVKISKK